VVNQEIAVYRKIDHDLSLIPPLPDLLIEKWEQAVERFSERESRLEKKPVFFINSFSSRDLEYVLNELSYEFLDIKF
jgi:hypothetical protein